MTWTEYYISANAGGGGAGTSEADPFTLAEWWAGVQAGAGTIPNGSRGNVKNDGTYTLADTTITRAAAGDAPIMTQGYNLTIGDGGKATIQRQAGETSTWWSTSSSGDYLNYRDLIFDGLSIGDGAGSAFAMRANNISVNCEFRGGLFATGCVKGAYVNCYIHGITCATMVSTAQLFFCRMLGDVISSSGQVTTACFLFHCIVKVTGSGATVAGAVATSYGVHTIFDGSLGSDGCIEGDVYSRYPLVNCVFMNGSSGSLAVSAGALLINPVFYNNAGGNYDNAKATVINEREGDPKFVDTAGWDYRIRNRSMRGSGLSDAGMSRVNYSVSPGIDQVATVIAASGDVIETENAYGYSGDSQGGTYVRASGDQVIEGTDWGEDGTEFTGLWDRPTTAQVEADVEYGPTTKLTGTLETVSTPIALTLDGEVINLYLMAQKEANTLTITVTDVDGNAVTGVGSAGTEIEMWGKRSLDGTTSGYLFTKTTSDFTKNVGSAANVISVVVSESEMDWYGDAVVIVKFTMSGSNTQKGVFKVRARRTPE